MTRPGLLALIAAMALAAPAATAQPLAPEQGDGRFTFHRADDGYLRLDGKTGQVSICSRRPSGWQCQLLPDERSALEIEIARLQTDNAALKQALLSRNLPLPSGVRSDPPVAKSDDQHSQDRFGVEVNRFVIVVVRVWRRLVEFIAGVQREILRRI